MSIEGRVRHMKYKVGDRVEDTVTLQAGTVVYCYEHEELLRDEIVAVRFDGDDLPRAYPCDDLRKARP
jgi:hypothetical protein